MIEPPVWLPVAIGSMPAATAAAEPADDPPGVCARLCGLRVAAGSRLASSDVAVLPITMPPARCAIGLGPVARIDRRSVLGRKSRRVENVLDADRQAA